MQGTTNKREYVLCPLCGGQAVLGASSCQMCGGNFLLRKRIEKLPVKIVALVFILAVFGYIAQIFWSIGGVFEF